MPELPSPPASRGERTRRGGGEGASGHSEGGHSERRKMVADAVVKALSPYYKSKKVSSKARGQKDTPKEYYSGTSE